MIRKLLTIHIPQQEGRKRRGGRVRATPELNRVLAVISEEFGRPELRITKQGVSVYVDTWRFEP